MDHLEREGINISEIFELMLALATPKRSGRGFPGGSVVKNLPANAGDMGSIPHLGRSHMPGSNY